MKNVFTMMMAAGLMAVGVAGCGGDACLSRCQEGKDMGCITPSTDCETACDDADALEAEARLDAEAAGCVAELDALISCTEARPACETTGCEAETSAYTDCFVAFCTANPMAEACAAP